MKPSKRVRKVGHDGYDFSVVKVSCCQKTDKWPSFCLKRHVCSNEPDVRISVVNACRTQSDRSYSMLYDLSD